jgi:hypothetical protein
LLLLDRELPYANPRLWRYWTNDGRRELPRPWPEPGDRRLAGDGAEYALQTRLVDFDPLAQRAVRQIRATMWRNGELLTEEEHELTENFYFAHELVLMLERAGFVAVDVRGQYDDRPPTADDETLVFLGRRPRRACRLPAS